MWSWAHASCAWERGGLKSDSLAALFLMAAVGCAHAAAPSARTEIPSAAPGERFALRRGDSVKIAGTPAKITFEKVVSDNRCPVDVVCVVAGEARAFFSLDEPAKPSRGFELDTARASNATVNGYGVSLLAVSPAPRSTVRIEPRDYVVELTVTPQ